MAICKNLESFGNKIKNYFAIKIKLRKVETK